jgi:hypothetical protein
LEDRQDGRTVFVPANTITNPFIDEGYITTLWNNGIRSRERQLLGIFDFYDSDASLLEFSDIQSVWTSVPKTVSPNFLTVDIGGVGEKADATVFTV